MSDFKWRDVAHYYAKSRIQIQLLRGSNPKKGELVNVANMLYVLFDADKAHKDQYCSHVSFEWSKPILRHLEDMTEEEDAECAKVHCYFVDEEITGLPSVIWALAKRHASFNQYSAYWLISRGFDLFGLIESGEAIRKEASNGNG